MTAHAYNVDIADINNKYKNYRYYQHNTAISQ